MRNRQAYLSDSNHLPYFLKDFHDQKDVFKTMYSWWNDKIENATHIKWVDGHIFIIDFFLWFMAIHGYTLQKSRADVDFLTIDKSIEENKKEIKNNFLSCIESPKWRVNAAYAGNHATANTGIIQNRRRGMIKNNGIGGVVCMSEKIKKLADKIEDFVYQITPDIESLESVMVELSIELKERYIKETIDSMSY